MILYFLKTIILLGIFYTLYTLLLKNAKTFRWNRMYLVFTAILTMVLPFVNAVSFDGNAEVVKNNKAFAITLDTISIYANAVKATEFDFGKLVLGIYIVGLLWGLLRITLGFIVIRRITQNSNIEKYDKQTVYFNEMIESPFSFNNNIFIPNSFKEKPVLQTILQHEMAHISMLHSRDKILFSFLQAFIWFNPFVYLYHKELELIHEFEADDFTTKKIATDDYVQNLLQTITYNQTPTLLVHQFFHHPLKTRITMLYTTSKNAIVQKSVVAIATLLVCLFTFYMQSDAQKKSNKNYKLVTYPPDSTLNVRSDGDTELTVIYWDALQDKVYEVADVMPEFIGGEQELYNFISDNLRYPAFEAKNNIEGKVVINFIVDYGGKVREVKAVRIPERGENLATEAIRVVKSMPRWKPGLNEGDPVSVSYSLPIDFKLK